MRPNALLDAAAGLLHRVLAFEQPADRAVQAFFREHPALGARERQTLADTTYRVLRHLDMLRHLAGADGPGRDRRLAVLGWQGSEGLLQSALSADERDGLAASRAAAAVAPPAQWRYHLPAWIATPLQQQLGDEFAAWATSVDGPAPLDLRVNSEKSDRRTVLAALAEEGVAAAPTRYSPLGIRVEGKPSLGRSALVESGVIEVQDEGSQLLALLTGARRGEMVADFCAGAGGKTLALGAQMRNTGRLYAVDVSGHRLARLAPRLERSGLANVHAMQIAHERDERLDRLAGKLDRVLVDAPCTGLGTLRRHPDLKWRQTEADLAALGLTQRAILAAAARLVKPGGHLVYATCSPLAAENEAVAGEFDAVQAGRFTRVSALAALQRARIDDAASLVSGADLRLWTHRHGTDGFFAAIWRRH